MTRTQAIKALLISLGVAYAGAVAAWFLVAPANGVAIAVLSTLIVLICLMFLED